MRRVNLIAAATMSVLVLASCAGPKSVNGGPAPSAGGTQSPEGTTPGSSAAGPVDVCSLLTDEEAVEVATKQHLVNSSSVKYTIEHEKQTYSPEVVKPPLGGCKFQFYSETADYPRSINATVVIEAHDASDFGLYKSGKPVPGLGDEAYKSTGSTVVREGNVMLSAGENSATDDFVVAMYRPMLDNLH
jgi:hypothetical protein